MEKRILIILFVACIVSCIEEPQIDLTVFVPSFSVTKTQLLNDDFEIVPDSDIPMLYKKVADTTIVFTFDFDSKSLLTKSWIVPYENLKDIECFHNYIKNWTSSTEVMCLSGFFDGVTPKNLIYNYKYNQPYEITHDKIDKTFSIKYFYFNPAE